MVSRIDRQKLENAPQARRAAVAELMEFFYPVHYEIGTALEDVVRADVLSRQQAASLWLIRSQGKNGTVISRKQIEINLRRWFEVTSAAVTRSLRAMMRPPLELIEMIEDPTSGRQKLVVLTPKGREFLDSVADQATQVLAEAIKDVPSELIESVIFYFGLLTRGFERFNLRSRIRVVQPHEQLEAHSIESSKRARARARDR
jgi:DNA-binding MarR family transcriptional regulator